MDSRLIRNLITGFALAFSSTCGASSSEHSPRLGGVNLFELGGGYVMDPPTQIDSVSILDMGAGWDLNMECGEFDPEITVGNQLNGVTDGFSNMMDNIIQSATSAVAALPALAIQRANPGLYDMLQQGILQGKMDFEAAEVSCEEMANVISGEESFPWEKFKLSAKVNNWSAEIGGSGGDAIQAKKSLDETNHGDTGVEWTCGETVGGAGQESIKALSDVVQVGYNVMFDRTDSCETSTIGAADGQGNPLWEYWPGPVAASQWARKVIGEMEIRTCDGCKKTAGTPGKGLTYMHRDMADVLAEDLEDLVDGSSVLSWQNFNRVSAPPGVRIDDTIIMAIRKRSADGQAAMIQKLAGEIAYARLVEQGRLLTQLLRTGIKEPNVAAFEPAKIIVDEAIDQLQIELDQLDMEVKTREAIAQNTILHILGQEEKTVQSMIAPTRGRSAGVNQVGQPN